VPAPITSAEILFTPEGATQVVAPALVNDIEPVATDVVAVPVDELYEP
jgi:hypothetical protein